MMKPETIRALLGAAIYVQAFAALVWAAVWYLIDAGRRVLEARVSLLERRLEDLEKHVIEFETAIIKNAGDNDRRLRALASHVQALRIAAGSWSADEEPEVPTFAQWQCPGCFRTFELAGHSFHSKCEHCGATLELVTFGANREWQTTICEQQDHRSTKLQR